MGTDQTPSNFNPNKAFENQNMNSRELKYHFRMKTETRNTANFETIVYSMFIFLKIKMVSLILVFPVFRNPQHNGLNFF